MSPPFRSLLLISVFAQCCLHAEEKSKVLIETNDAYSEKFTLNPNHVLPRDFRSRVNQYSEYLEDRDTVAFQDRLLALLQSIRQTDYNSFQKAASSPETGQSTPTRVNESIFFELAEESEIWANKSIRVLLGSPIRVKTGEQYFHAWVYLNANKQMEQPSGAMRFTFFLEDERLYSMRLRRDDGNRSFFLPAPSTKVPNDPIRVLPEAR